MGADVACSVNQLAAAVAEAMGVAPALRHFPARNEVKHAFSSHEKAHRILGAPAAPVSLREGLARMAAWARRAGPRESQPFKHIEILKNLPKAWVTGV